MLTVGHGLVIIFHSAPKYYSSLQTQEMHGSLFLFIPHFLSDPFTQNTLFHIPNDF